MIGIDQMVAYLRARHGDDWTTDHLAQAIQDALEPRDHWGMRWMDMYQPAPRGGGGLELTPRARLALRLDQMAYQISESASLARARQAKWMIWRARA